MIYEMECPECGRVYEARRRDKRTCGEARCRKADLRRRQELGEARTGPEPDLRGANVDALDTWLETVEAAPAPLIAAARSLAAELDRAPRQSALWGRYLDALGQLLEIAGGNGNDDDLDRLLDEIRMTR